MPNTFDVLGKQSRKLHRKASAMGAAGGASRCWGPLGRTCRIVGCSCIAANGVWVASPSCDSTTDWPAAASFSWGRGRSPCALASMPSGTRDCVPRARGSTSPGRFEGQVGTRSRLPTVGRNPLARTAGCDFKPACSASSDARPPLPGHSCRTCTVTGPDASLPWL